MEQDNQARGMSVKQRVLISAGGALLVLLMVIAAFSIGVYVGEERSAPSQPGAAAPGQPPTGGALERPPDLAGKVEVITGDILTISTPDGPRTVTLRSDTEIHRPDGSAGSRDDLRRGVDVGVLGHPADDGRSFEADVIVILAPAQRR